MKQAFELGYRRYEFTAAAGGGERSLYLGPVCNQEFQRPYQFVARVGDHHSGHLSVDRDTVEQAGASRTYLIQAVGVRC